MIVLLLLGLGGIAGAVILALCKKGKMAILSASFGVLCLVAVVIMILALAHFGEVPRH